MKTEYSPKTIMFEKLVQFIKENTSTEEDIKSMKWALEQSLGIFEEEEREE